MNFHDISLGGTIDGNFLQGTYGVMVHAPGWRAFGIDDHWVFQETYEDVNVPTCINGKVTIDLHAHLWGNPTSRDYLWSGRYTVITREPSAPASYYITFFEAGTLTGHTIFGNGLNLAPQTAGTGTTITRNNDFSDSLFVNIPCTQTPTRVFIDIDTLARKVFD